MPTLQLGMTINVSLSLKTTPEYSLPQNWCSDTASTIQYILSKAPTLSSLYCLLLSFLFFSLERRL
jgi:hypothetical protein